jgi:hypothetical protein
MTESRQPAPEWQLLLRCLGPDFFDSSGFTSGYGAEDQARFLEACRRNSVRPRVQQRLAQMGWKGVPAPLRLSLDQFTVRNTRRNTLLGLELGRVVTLLAERGIRSLTFKGPVLAESVYGGVASREFLDLDLLVQPHDVAATQEILAGEGYARVAAGDDREYLCQSGQLSLRHAGAGYGIDLHWKLAPFGMPFPFPESELWDDLQYLPVVGTPVPTFSWNHLALFMAFHGAKERWRSLKWICDFSELCRVRPELDWEFLLQKANRAGCSRSLLIAGSLCRSLGLYAPDRLTEAAEHEPSVAASVRRISGKLVRGEPETELSQFLDALALSERLRHKAVLTYNLLTTLTVSDFRVIRLHPRLRWLYYAIRPVRLTGKICGMMVQTYLPRTAR